MALMSLGEEAKASALLTVPKAKDSREVSLADADVKGTGLEDLYMHSWAQGWYRCEGTWRHPHGLGRVSSGLFKAVVLGLPL